MPRKTMVNLTESMFYVLMAFSGGSMCGTDVAEHIDKITQGRVKLGPGTLYTILGKFEKEKYIAQIHQDGRKRTYTITQKGKKAYDDELLRLSRCLEDARRGEADSGDRGED